MFFVATAPSGDEGHVNLSPKGLDTFRVLDDRTVAYLDLTGSGAETIAHLRENGRITIMFCGFEGPPRIVRIHGRGEVLRPGDDGFDDLVASFPALPGTRAVIRVEGHRFSSSCGYAVPRMDLRRPSATRCSTGPSASGPDGIESYWAEKNVVSLDGLPAVGIES